VKIRDLFQAQPQTFSFEFFPPKTAQDVDELCLRARELQALGPSFISVTYGAGGSTRRNTIDLVCRFQAELSLTAMAHVTCVGHSQAELREVLEELQARGIDNVMCLRGDPPRGQSNFVPAPDGFAYAYELVRLARTLGDFCIGVAGYPETHPDTPDKQRDLEHLKAKVECGADFITTQLFFDTRDYFDFCARAQRLGITTRIIPGIMPITNYRQIVRFATMCGARIPTELHQRFEPVAEDPQAVLEIGVDWAWRQCEALLAGGAPGIHFYTLNRSLATQRIFERLQESSVAALLPAGAGEASAGEAMSRQHP
jgi:methylenetetrahydrofolate reductase (NADPH)